MTRRAGVVIGLNYRTERLLNRTREISAAHRRFKQGGHYTPAAETVQPRRLSSQRFLFSDEERLFTNGLRHR